MARLGRAFPARPIIQKPLGGSTVNLTGLATSISSGTSTVDVSLSGTSDDTTSAAAPLGFALDFIGKSTDITSDAAPLGVGVGLTGMSADITSALATVSAGLGLIGRSVNVTSAASPLDIALSAYLQAISAAYATNTGPDPIYLTALAASISSASVGLSFTAPVFVWLAAPQGWQPWNIPEAYQVVSWDTETYLGSGLGVTPALNQTVVVANVLMGIVSLKVWIDAGSVQPLG